MGRELGDLVLEPLEGELSEAGRLAIIIEHTFDSREPCGRTDSSFHAEGGVSSPRAPPLLFVQSGAFELCRSPAASRAF